MTAERTVAPARPEGGPIRQETVDRLARWLLVAVGLDLVVTRFLVRLAIFVPKGEPFASAAAVLGRIGAVTDSLVPIVAILLLFAMLVRAGSRGGLADQAILAAILVIAAGGLALVVLPPTPMGVVLLGLLAAAVAVVLGGRLALDRSLPPAARAGLALLAGSVAVAAAARSVDAVAFLTGTGSGLSIAGGAVALGLGGQVLFLTGAGLTGLAGVVGPGLSPGRRRPLAAAGAATGLIVVVAGVAAPLAWASLTTWSLGLTGAVPVLAAAIAAGLAVAGLPALFARAPAAALGAGTVILAGYALAASGLLVASLLGLAVAAIAKAPNVAAGRGSADVPAST